MNDRPSYERRAPDPPAEGEHPELYRLYLAGYHNVYQKENEDLSHLLHADTPLKMHAALLGEVHARFSCEPLQPEEFHGALDGSLPAGGGTV